MEFKNQNLLNVFKPSEVSPQAISGVALALLPAAYVAKTIESALIFLLLSLIYFILTTLSIKLVQTYLPKKGNFLFATLSFVTVAVFVSLLSNAFFVTFASNYNHYVVLLSVSALPYMLEADNKDKDINRSMLNTLQSFVGFAILMILIAIFREVIGTGMITFGKFTDITYQIDLFSKYALTVFAEPLGAFMMLGFIAALVKGKGDFI